MTVMPNVTLAALAAVRVTLPSAAFTCQSDRRSATGTT
jgi:hypothetical protein